MGTRYDGGLNRYVHQDGAVPVVEQVRLRKTVAEVNAGVDLLAAIPGWKYRLIDANVIAIGGTTAGGTSVDIKGTRAAGAVILLSALIAGLARSVLLRMGAATNGVILADGASYTALDANTAITAITAGSAFTGVTHFDFILFYCIEE